MTSDLDFVRRLDELTSRVEQLSITVEAAGMSTTTHKIETLLRQSDLRRVRMGDAAEKLRLTPQTLARRLDAEGARFKTLLDNERYRRVAERLRIDPHATCTELTEVAGYSDHQNLVRSFRRWFGVGLLEYKNGRGAE